MRPVNRARPLAPPDGRPANAIGRPANADSRLGKLIGSLVSAADSPVNVVGRLANPVCGLAEVVCRLVNAVCRPVNADYKLVTAVHKFARPPKTAHFPQKRPVWPFPAARNGNPPKTAPLRRIPRPRRGIDTNSPCAVRSGRMMMKPAVHSAFVGQYGFRPKSFGVNK